MTSAVTGMRNDEVRGGSKLTTFVEAMMRL